MKPIAFNPRSETIEQFKDSHPVFAMVDQYRELLLDLFLIRNPKFKFSSDYSTEFEIFLTEHADNQPLESCGTWFYFPWNQSLVHYLPDALHQELRTARNRNLITSDEQQMLRNFTVGIAGMSVGSHCALTLNMMGISRVMKIADPDELSGSNLNRVRYDYMCVGKKKSAIVREQMYQMDPYGQVDEFPDGVHSTNIEEFLRDIDVLIEETDHLESKILLREAARERGIPVLMATDNGDGVVVDIERFDQDKKLPLFNGVIGNISLEEFKTFPKPELPKLAAKIAGVDMIVPRMLTSLQEVGKTLYSWPQLGDAATLSGVTIAYAVQRLALQLPLRSGKIDVSLDAIFDPTFEEPDAKKKRDETRSAFKKAVGL